MTTLATLALVIAVAVSGYPEAAFLVAVLGLGVLWWLWWLIGRQVRAIGYADREDDLLVVSGILFKRLVVVPYGRMQQVDVRRGPIERYLGLATVQLHTAAATTDAFGNVSTSPPEGTVTFAIGGDGIASGASKLLWASSAPAVSVRVTHDTIRAPATSTMASIGASGLGLTAVSVTTLPFTEAEPFSPHSRAGLPLRS